jgi:hypothetical protein
MAKLKESVGKRILKRKKRGFNREIRVHNFDTAKSAVLLFDTSDPESFGAVKDFSNSLSEKGIKCSAFGYVHQKEIPQKMLFWKNYSFITKNHLNWYMKPSGEPVEAFYSADPDMLFDFTFGTCLETDYLVQLSTARFKVGCFTESENDYDLMISLTEDQCKVGYLAEQFKHYISMLNPTN